SNKNPKIYYSNFSNKDSFLKNIKQPRIIIENLKKAHEYENENKQNNITNLLEPTVLPLKRKKRKHHLQQIIEGGVTVNQNDLDFQLALEQIIQNERNLQQNNNYINIHDNDSQNVHDSIVQNCVTKKLKSLKPCNNIEMTFIEIKNY